MTGNTHGGAAQKRGPDFTSGNSFPMREDPVPLVFEKTLPEGPYDLYGKTYTPRQNAVEGRGRCEIYCKHCDARFSTEKEAARHVALTQHHVIVSRAHEIVPVDMHDDWTLWEDGAGVSYGDRCPELG